MFAEHNSYLSLKIKWENKWVVLQKKREYKNVTL